MRSDHSFSKIILLTIFALRMVPSVLMSIKFGTVSESAGPSIVQIVGDGLYLAILTSDLIIAKIASRQVHVLLPVIALASVISHHVSIVAAFVYHITIIYDLCTYLQVRRVLSASVVIASAMHFALMPCPQRPLLAPARRIYCDGVFDLLHVGHMAQFRKALHVTDGDYLLVGVMNDEDCVKYKRRPVMTEAERYEAVAACAFVNEVVKNAPEAVTEELLTKHRIDFVAAGEEYEDVAALKARGAYDYYAVPRAKNMLKFTSRTAGISTSDIIKRIRSREDLEPPAPAKGAAAKKIN
jgi:cytidyltransferase-like protein